MMKLTKDEELEFLYNWIRESREEEYNKFKKNINMEEFVDNAEFNKRLVLELNKVCKFGTIIEVEKVLFSNRGAWDYIYKLLFATFIMTNRKPDFQNFNFKFENTKQLKNIYYLYDYFYDSIYVTHMEYPQLPDINTFEPLVISEYCLEKLKKWVKRERENEIDMDDGYVEPNLILEVIEPVFLYAKDELCWFFFDEEIGLLENLYHKAKVAVSEIRRNQSTDNGTVIEECYNENQLQKDTQFNLDEGIKKKAEEFNKSKNDKEEKQELISDLIESKKENNNINTDEKINKNDIDLSKLKNEMEVKNYKEMCKLLGQKEKGGKAKILQIKDWARYFLYERVGHKFIIKEIFENILEKPDLRGGNNCIYIDKVETLIKDILLEKAENDKKIFRLYDFIEKLGFVNKNYVQGNQNKSKLSKVLSIDEKIIEQFYHYTYINFRSIIESALDRLDRNKILFLEKAIVIWDFNAGERREATSVEKGLILESEEEALKKMGRSKISEVIFMKKWEEFIEGVYSILSEKSHIKKYYRAYKIIDMREEHSKELLTLQKSMENKQYINSTYLNRYKNTIEKNAEKKKKSEDQLFLDELLGQIDNKKMDYSNEKYVQGLLKLADVMLDINSVYKLHIK